MSDSLIHLHVPAALKGRWIAASRDVGMKLGDWIVARVEAGNAPPPGALADRWLHAEGTETTEEYLVRTVPPRCIVAVAEPAAAQRANPEGRMNQFGEAFYVAQWLDPTPGPAEREAILHEAIAANEAFTLDSQ